MAAALDRVGAEQILSLYLHIPFCREICWYCGCNTGAANRTARLDAYLARLHGEIDLVAARLAGRGRIGRIAFGGGSPNAIPPAAFAALVAHLVNADVLALLTDTAGLFTSDPRLNSDASLIEEIVEIDHELEQMAGGAGTVRGSGGMTSKLAAAKIAAWSGVRTVIASAERTHVLIDAVAGRPGVGTVILPHDRDLPARKLWIAFAVGSTGSLVVDDGAARALTGGGTSLLAAGVVDVQGDFDEDDAVEITRLDGRVIAKGLVRVDAATAKEIKGKRSADLPDGAPRYIVHRDDLVMLPS